MSREKKQKNTLISLKEPILPGSISISYLPCGKETCLCKTDTKYWHGPYYRWSGFIEGKRTTRNIPPELVKECKIRIKNYQKLIEEWDKLMQQALKDAPWNSKPT